MSKPHNKFESIDQKALTTIYGQRYKKMCINSDKQLQRDFKITMALQTGIGTIVWIPPHFDIESGIDTNMYVNSELKASLHYDFETHRCNVWAIKIDNGNEAGRSIISRYVSLETGMESANNWALQNL